MTLNQKTVSNKVLLDRLFNVARNPKYDGHQRGLAYVVYKYFDKHSSGGAIKKKDYVEQTISRRITQANYQKV